MEFLVDMQNYAHWLRVSYPYPYSTCGLDPNPHCNLNPKYNPNPDP